jgi:hypothetical protein
MPTQKLKVKTYKRIDNGGVTFLYHNRYVFACEFGLASLALCEDLCRRVVTFETYFHLSTTQWQPVTVGIYGGWPEQAPQTSELTFPVEGANFIGRRETLEPAPPHYALRLIKRVLSGRHGHVWYFNALSMNDVALDVRGRVRLVNPAYWENVLFDASVVAWDGIQGTLVVPQLAGTREQAMSFVEGHWRVGNVSFANGIKRKLPKRDSRGVEMYERIRSYLDDSARAWLELRGWHALGTDFNPKELKGKLQPTLSAGESLYDTLFDLLENGDPPVEGKHLKPIFRFGATSQEIIAKCNSLKQRWRQQQEDWGKIVPYLFEADGIEYFKLLQLEAMEGFFKPFHAGLGELLDADWFTDEFEEME